MRAPAPAPRIGNFPDGAGSGCRKRRGVHAPGGTGCAPSQSYRDAARVAGCAIPAFRPRHGHRGGVTLRAAAVQRKAMGATYRACTT